jgi:hypothetical protein
MSNGYSEEWPEITCTKVNDSSSLLQCGEESYVVEHTISDQEEFLELGLRWGAAIAKRRLDEKVLADLRALSEGEPQELLTESSWGEIATLRDHNNRLARANSALVEILQEMVLAVVSRSGVQDAMARARIILHALSKR